MFKWFGWRQLRRARKAASSRDWESAARLYTVYLRRRPRQGTAWIQLGHALKEGGKLAACLAAYRRATELLPDMPEAWLQFGHALRLSGDRTAAVEAFQRSVERNPSFAAGLEELIALGERERLSEGAQSLAEGGETSERIYAVSRYAAYRRKLTIAPPPGVALGVREHIAVLIDARLAQPAGIRATLLSLMAQTMSVWTAVVIGGGDLTDHPLASLGQIDRRIRFVAADDAISLTDSDLVLCLSAGTECDRFALDWFAFAAQRTGADLLYCDDDVLDHDWEQGRSYDRPLLQPMFDAIWFSDASVTPAAVLQRRERIAAGRWDDAVDRQSALLAAGSDGIVAHIPLILVSRDNLSRPTEPNTARSHDAAGCDVIQVVIQTRDQARLLGACVASLRAKAKHPDLLDIVIVNNRSVEPETVSLLERWKTRGTVRIVTHDEPFNWARANNIAAARSDAPMLLFLNNDTEAKTDGWDDLLRERLRDPQTGVVGAQLLYPDGSIQHAGVILGMDRVGPMHEGVATNPDLGGPSDRWRRSRLTAAVTGAWLGMRRNVFELVGGFDERLAIAFNDIDLCLRARAAQFVVVQDARITALHRESMTRGLHLTEAALAWDLGEFQTLRDRWGAALCQDPAYNPSWTRRGRPFDGLRFPNQQEIVAWLDRSAIINPWSVANTESGDRTQPVTPFD
jgi:GT2 family glycosyltransferase/tetratricopeptide (TPR) repeat protein